MGTSAGTQEELNRRWRTLSEVPAQMRWLSLEPLIVAIDGSQATKSNRRLWCVIGSESGPRRRPCRKEWVERLLDQCWQAQVPVWLKQFEIDGKVEHDGAVLADYFGATIAQIRQWPERPITDHEIRDTIHEGRAND